MAKALEPWQAGATELLEKAIGHLHLGTDADQRVAYLLLDVGVETVFKTFLLLPVKVTKTKLSFADRKRVAEGSFHDVVEGIETAASDRLKGINLARVEYYHGVRNKLYHEGSGITVGAKQVQEYARLAVDLLKALLEVDLTPELNKPQIDAKRQQRLKAKKAKEQKELDARTGEVQEARKKVEYFARLAIEKVDPSLALPSFEQDFNQSIRTSASQPSEVRKIEIDQLLSGMMRNLDQSELVRDRLLLDLNKPTPFYLTILQSAIQTPDQESWLGVYVLSGLYPRSFPMHERFFQEDSNAPGECLVDVIEHSHKEILNNGAKWVQKVMRIAETLEEWVKTQDSLAKGCSSE
jgi:hypothetical protein